MKNKAGAAFHMSGYLLKIAGSEKEKNNNGLSLIKAVQKEPVKFTAAHLANNPRNWDSDWFCNYE
jgi:hypothetical protein